MTIAIEREAEYLPLIEQRIARATATQPTPEPEPADPEPAEPPTVLPGQLNIFGEPAA